MDPHKNKPPAATVESSIQTRRERRAAQPYPTRVPRPGDIIHGNMTIAGSGPGVSVKHHTTGEVTFYASWDDLPHIVDGDVTVGAASPLQAETPINERVREMIAPFFNNTNIVTTALNTPGIHIGNYIVQSSSATPNQRQRPVINISTAPFTPANVGGNVYRITKATSTPTYPEMPKDHEATTTDDDKMCKICFDRVKSTVMVPCGCMYSCVTCVRKERPTVCAICRHAVANVVRFHSH